MLFKRKNHHGHHKCICKMKTIKNGQKREILTSSSMTRIQKKARKFYSGGIDADLERLSFNADDGRARFGC